MIDRRAVFFLISATVCLVLVLPTPRELKWVGPVLAAWFALLALGSWLDHRGRQRLPKSRQTPQP